MTSVYITSQIPRIGTELLLGKGYKVDVNKTGKDLSTDDLKKVFGHYDGVITMLSNKVDAALLGSASKNLKVIANYAVGFDNLDVEAIRAKRIIATNTPGVANESVAEQTMALILALSKKLFLQDKFVRDGKYERWDPNLFVTPQVWGRTMGIIGLGRIGTFVGQMAYGGFRMKILYFDIKRAEDFELLCEAEFTSIETILKNADIVTLHLPLTPKTKHLISKNEFKIMKNTAILINTARGAIVEEEALVRALATGEIAGAGLDVYEHEPVISRELFKLDNVVLTPHAASATVETREEMARFAAQNVIDVLEGKEPAGLIGS